MKKWLLCLGLLMLVAVPARAQMTTVSALVMDANGERYVNCSWSVVFVGQNTVPGAGPYQPAALLVGQQGECDSSGNLTVTLADNVSTIRPIPSQWNFSICSAPGYVPGGTYCRSNMLVTITGQTQNLTSFFQPLMPLLPTGGGGGGGGGGYITDATPLMGLMKTGTTLGLQTTCVQGQYLGWTGSAWACTGAGVGSGTLVSINGIQAVPNSLNFTNILTPPVGSSVVNFLLNGNTVGAYVTGGGGGGGSLTVNGAPGGSDLNDRLPQFPPNGINISWNTANGHISGAIVGDGIATHCFLGTGVFAQCPGSGGGNATLPPTPQYDLFASTGAGAAQASGVLGSNGFVRAQVYTATGDVGTNQPAFQLFPNASVEYFPPPAGYTTSQGTFGAAHGLALYMSHSGGANAAANGGIALGGGNSSGAGNQVYLDCETTGCDFKVAPTYNGAAIGGGAGSLPVTADVLAGNNSGGALATGVSAQAGYLRGEVLESSGSVNNSPFSVPNASIEYFPTGGYGAGGPNGLAMFFSHSGISGAAGNGGVALAGGNTGAGSTYQVYLDCEVASGCGTQLPMTAPQINVNGASGTGIAMTGTGGTLPTTLTSGQGGLGIGPGGVPMMNVNNGGWVAIPTSGGASAGVTSINTVPGAFTFGGPGVSCTGTNCTFSGSGTGAGGGAPNQTAPITGTPPTATITSTVSSAALIWACWDGNTPANAIYPSNVSLNPTTSTITFTFLAPQTGYCAINGSGSGPQYVNSSFSGLSWSIPATTHNLGAVVNVHTYDANGNEIFGNTTIDNLGNVTIAWLMAQAGKVVISQ